LTEINGQSSAGAHASPNRHRARVYDVGLVRSGFRDPPMRFASPFQRFVPTATNTARRRLLALGAAFAAAPWAALPARASSDALRALSLRHTHTGETLALAYAAGESYFTDALGRVDWFLRDFRNGETHAIDPALLDQLHTLAAVTGTKVPFEVISGYRSATTNEALRKRSGGVARGSLHLEGRAIDVRLADVGLADLRDAAISLGAGGVGFYPESQFVHLDTGGVRRW
jgi:uncharacterized protein YcbK (DUF882 family)